MNRTLALVAIAFLVAACSKEDEVAPPAELVDFDPQVRVERVWSAGTKGGDDVLRLGLRPAVEGDRVYVAGHGGDVQALTVADGKSLWRVDTELELSGGPAVGEGVVAVGSSGGDLVALDSATGAERWRVATGGEVLAAPIIAEGIIVVRTVDGRLRGLRAADGSEAWSYEQPVPRLTLRGNGSPVVDGDMVVAGLDNGKVVSLSLTTGELLWSTTVAPSQGRTEIERLVDIDSPVRVIGDDIYVVGYHGRIAMLARDTGQLWWGRELSSNRGLAVDGDTIYVTTADSSVVALRRRDGTPVWSQDGVIVCAAANAQTLPFMVSDELGGAIIAWEDRRLTGIRVYAQRVDASGTTQWGVGGVEVSTSGRVPNLVEDGTGGAIVIFSHVPRAQRLSTTGQLLWGSSFDGVALRSALPFDGQLETYTIGRAAGYSGPAVPTYTRAVGNVVRDAIGDGNGGPNGAIVAWKDLRNVSNGTTYIDIYAQRVRGSGAVAWGASGVSVGAGLLSQLTVSIVAGGAGGTIVFWMDVADLKASPLTARVAPDVSD